jgi:hypothetical protein
MADDDILSRGAFGQVPADGDPFATSMIQPMAQPGEMPHAIMPEQERELGGGGTYEPIPLLGGGSPAPRPGATEPAPGDPYAPAAERPVLPAEQATPPRWHNLPEGMEPLAAEEAAPPAITMPEVPRVQQAGLMKPPEAQPLLKQDDPWANNPIDTHPQEKALNVNEILHPDNPAIDPATGEAYKSRSRNVTEIASDLHDRSQAALKDLGIKSGQITGPNPVTDELIARSMAAEAKAALSRPGANASDWYTGRINEGMGAASAMYPEIAIDPNARTAFQAALAVTSQGETVPSNVRLATQAYEYYRQNGRFPEDIVAKEAPSMNTNFGKLNDLVDTGGPDGMREFLNRQTTVRELKDLGHSVGGENMDTPVYGSAILGPKIGQGFFQNLGGNFDPVTMDLWFMRHWGRQTGTLVGASDTSAQKLRLQNALGDAGLPVPRTDTQLMNRAQKIFADHERDFVVNRDLYNSGERTKSELTNAAQRWIYANQGINQSPTSGGQRNWMRSVVGRAREILAGEGHDVTNADLQAILWYPEKDLYSKLGGRESAGINVDYATTLTNAARAKGVPENELQQAIRTASGRPGPSGGTGEPGGAGGNPPQAAGALPQAPAQTGASPAAGAAPEAPGISLEPANGDPYGGS